MRNPGIVPAGGLVLFVTPETDVMSHDPDNPDPNAQQRLEAFLDCVAYLLAKRWLNSCRQADDELARHQSNIDEIQCPNVPENDNGQAGNESRNGGCANSDCGNDSQRAGSPGHLALAMSDKNDVNVTFNGDTK